MTNSEINELHKLQRKLEAAKRKQTRLSRPEMDRLDRLMTFHLMGQSVQKRGVK